MSRSHDAAFFECPICGKQPYVETFKLNYALAYCKGYGFHKHKKVSVSAHNHGRRKAREILIRVRGYLETYYIKEAQAAGGMPADLPRMGVLTNRRKI